MRLPGTAFALVSIGLWGFFAFLVSGLGEVPPFLVGGLALTIGGLCLAGNPRDWRVPFPTLATGVAGLFLYNAFCVAAYRRAPVIEANLVNYLWPLLMVVLSPVLLRGFPLRPQHVLGALAGFAGTALIVSGGRLSIEAEHLAGYAFAAAGALTWAWYSLMLKRLPPFPGNAVGAFSLGAGLLALSVHACSPGAWASVRSLSAEQWRSLVMLGVGPTAVAYRAWDEALKRGDPRAIGSLSYLTPLASVSVLVVLGGQRLTWVSALAAVLIVGGAVVGSIRPRAG